MSPALGCHVVRAYSYGLDLISQRQLILSTWNYSYYGYDGHGSVRTLTDSAGSVTDTYTYDAFGNLIERTGSTPNNYLYSGEQFDPDLGLYYNRARYLDVRNGRFWGMDTYEGTLPDVGQLHRYLYSEADPVDTVDRSGHFATALEAQFTAATVATLATLTVLRFPSVQKALSNAIGNATTNAGELYNETSYAAGRAMAEAELAIQPLYMSIIDAIAKAKEKAKTQLRRIRNRLKDIKVVPISYMAMPNIAAHIAAAQLSGYPITLTRTTSAQAILNREAATGFLPPAGSGMSWDEYPFAISAQGGAGASVAPVPVREQFIQGGTIIGSFSVQKINVGDNFFVVLIP